MTNKITKVYKNGVEYDIYASGGAAGAGDVSGPASATNGHLAVFDGITGKLIKDGGAVPTGTITGITMNGASKGTSGVVDLGTVITEHQDISGKADIADVLTKENTTSYTPTANYHPATKKYVDDIVGNIETLLAAI